MNPSAPVPSPSGNARPRRRVAATLLLSQALALPVRAAEVVPPADWHARTLAEALGHLVLFAAVGVAAAILGYKLFDRFTPGNLHQEILENRNTAAAIIGAAIILGVCGIVAAAMLG